MENPVLYLVDLVKYSILGEESKHRKHSKLVKVHNEDLKKFGDLSFSVVWQNGKIIEDDFQNHGRSWIFPISKTQIHNNRCQIYLDRTTTCTIVLKHVLTVPDYGKIEKNQEKRIHLQEVDENITCDSELSSYRLKLTADILKKIIKFSDWLETLNEGNGLNVKMISMSSSTAGTKISQETNTAVIKVGIVVDPLNNKIAKITANEYIRLRSTDMRLMAMHKYGIRVKDDAKFCDLIDNLGKAAVCVDFFEVKHSSPVKMIRNTQGSTKGASFILYNSARIETLLKTFDERVANKLYAELPNLNDINFSILTEEEEWQLIYGYIFSFPHLIQRCLEQIEDGSLSLHLIVMYLNGLVSTFSVYYRRVRILTDTRDHLMPYVYARIYLIKAIRNILNRTLAFLSISPVEFM